MVTLFFFTGKVPEAEDSKYLYYKKFLAFFDKLGFWGNYPTYIYF